YVDALCSEFNERIKEMACPFRTVYVGGGTPSLMPCEEFVRLFDNLKPYLKDIEEFTIEVNPDDVNEKYLQVWKSAGVNRLSIGIQSFDDKVLTSLGRLHDASSACRAYELSRRYFDNISVDLMFGLPGQTVDMWTADLKKVVAMRPEHISAYSLMYEEGTALTLMRDCGRVAEMPDDTCEKMFLVLVNELKKAGYEHYETSNFALPGYRSIHNSSYWRQMPYLGIGPSAHSYDGLRTRKSNRADLRGYIDCWSSMQGEDSTFNYGKNEGLVDMEVLTDEELREEYILTRMRTREGIDVDDFERRFGVKESRRLLARAKFRIEEGSLLLEDGHLALSENAIMISDSIIVDLA
ncbi:MAG: radical SAM family heme chaperone HemW, partial [Muribaculaceae bacterium]|nr:radical SAM family heme chaperone HemW [Muribaculaceae bacterium]